MCNKPASVIFLKSHQMKCFCFAFLMLITFTSVAQDTYEDIAYKKHIPAGVGDPIRMPDRNYSVHTDTTDYDLKVRVIIIRDNQSYYKMFSQYVYTRDSLDKYRKQPGMEYFEKWMLRYMRDSLPKIDFSKKELILYSACAQCLAYCEHEGRISGCHRNVCNFKDTWFIRNKPTTALFDQRIPANSLPCDISFAFPATGANGLRKYFEVGQYSAYRYTIDSDTLYYKVFAGHSKETLPKIDFSKQQLVARVACHQCLATCNTLKPCHRNACRYSVMWCVREKGRMTNDEGE